MDGDRTRVAIAGGGVAALEAMLTLRELGGERVEIHLYAPRADFVYRPLAVTEPFGAGGILTFDLGELAGCADASFHRASLVSVEAAQRRAMLHGNKEISYDYLLIATGTKSLWAVPGATTFWGVADDGGVADLVGNLRAGKLGRVVFTMPGGSGWPLPVYELALLTAADLVESGRGDVQLTVVTPEDAPLQLFGVQASEQVASLLGAHGIQVVTGTHPVRFADEQLVIAPGAPIPADAVISLPRLEGRRIAGVPHDPEGFIPIDEHGRVQDLDRVLAAGDVTAFPVKQGGIASQQADVAAEAIAAEAWGYPDPRSFEPVLRGVLLTGEEPRFLSGRLTGGKGATSSMTGFPLWRPEGKIFGERLTPFLEGLKGAGRGARAQT